ncbi:MAG: LuxR C-terminal-related transcriptional regulator [Oscillospiraceae bacterium]|nr:LuxR C-terminal-related transcriptional regulator [Oscillospiraceae bacterium]MDD4367635.1 LuxR C-terminal-related transcriptional regulator [Oscillospiraceae bacterium]
MDHSLYLPPRLKNKLERIRHNPVTVVFAPAGYGKTALLSKWVRESGLRFLWADVEDQTPQKGYARFCQALAQAGVPQAARLSELGFPGHSSHYEIADLLRQCDCGPCPLLLLLDTWLARALDYARPDDLRLPFLLCDRQLASFAPAALYNTIRIWLNRPLLTAAAQESGVSHLMAREREIARLAGLGLRNKEIALQLFISQGTVRNHLNEVFQKLAIDRRSQLKDFLDQL